MGSEGGSKDEWQRTKHVHHEIVNPPKRVPGVKKSRQRQGEEDNSNHLIAHGLIFRPSSNIIRSTQTNYLPTIVSKERKLFHCMFKNNNT